MYFVTEEPKLFNVETGVIWNIYSFEYREGEYYVATHHEAPHVAEGSHQECEDFVYSLAGWVGAVNPMVKGGGG